MDIEKLQKLNELKEKGILTEEEFQTEKEKILNTPTVATSYEEPPMISFKEAYKRYWIRSFVWKGRASRAEYWWPTLENFLIIVTGIFLSLIFPLLAIFLSIFSFITYFPNFAVTARRVHDIDKSAYFVSITLILLIVLGFLSELSSYGIMSSSIILLLIIVGLTLLVLGITLFVFSLLPGTKGDNKYGPQPE